ncbi:hypothetical protein N9605_06605, partial [Flavobacteriaceae bacterium]|nr:hypothetical protein [Flavobacteriaceae bacterium]
MFYIKQSISKLLTLEIKKFLLIIIFGFITSELNAQVPTAIAPQGSGTLDDPYLMSVPGNFTWIQPNESYSDGVYYLQVNHIDLSGYNWAPLPDFRGDYDGNGFEIRNLTINRPNEDRVGMFHTISYSVFKNLTIVNANVTGRDKCGILAYYLRENQGFKNVFIKNSTITGQARIAGMFSDVYNTHNGMNNVGLDNVTINSSGDRTGAISVYFRDASISNSYATGQINATGNYIGGFVEQHHTNSDIISNCYSSIDINASPNSTYVGGLAARVTAGQINNSYYNGTIDQSGSPGNKSGALFGDPNGGTSSGCFWDSNKTSLSLGSGDSNFNWGVAKTSGEMKTASTFSSAGWDSSIWDLSDNAYPILLNSLSLDPPSGISVTSADGQNTIAWLPSNLDYTGYKIFGGNSSNPTSPPTTLLGTVSSSITSFTHSGLTNGSTYNYRLKSMGSNGNSSDYSNQFSGIPDFSMQADVEYRVSGSVRKAARPGDVVEVKVIFENTPSGTVYISGNNWSSVVTQTMTQINATTYKIDWTVPTRQGVYEAYEKFNVFVLNNGVSETASIYPSTIIVGDLDPIAGDGSQLNPYQVSTPGNFTYIEINHGRSSGLYYIQTNHIDLSGLDWVPLYDFRGHYDGNDFEIRNLRVYRPREDENAFFGQLTNYGTISNLGFANASITGKDENAVFAAEIREYNITNCYVKNSVINGDDKNAPFSARHCCGVEYVSCYAENNTINATGSNSAGFATDARDISLFKCYASGTINSFGKDVGGLLNYQPNNADANATRRKGIIENCYSRVDINLAQGLSYIGGITGDYNRGRTTNSYYAGKITFGGDGTSGNYVGGLFGNPNSNNGGSSTGSFFDVTENASLNANGGTSNYTGGTPKTTTELQTASTFSAAGWDSNIWLLSDSDYPTLKMSSQISTPKGLTARPQDQKSLLSWIGSGNTSLSGYKIFGGTTANPTVLIGTVSSSTTTFTHSGLTNGTNYYYRIKAFDSNGNESSFSSEIDNTPEYQPSGDGTSSSPYLIATVDDLSFLTTRNDIGVTTTEYFLQTNNIDLSGLSWAPKSSDFKGKYDGGGFVISNMNIEYTNNDLEGVALFSRIKYGEIKNLGIVGATIRSGNNDTGVLVGSIENSSIVSNCFVNDATIIGIDTGSKREDIGGMFGEVDSYATIVNCTVSNTTINVTKWEEVGGFAGRFYRPSLLKNSHVSSITIDINNGINSYYNFGGFSGKIGDARRSNNFVVEDITVNNLVLNTTYKGYNVGGLFGSIANTDIIRSGVNIADITFIEYYSGGYTGKLDNSVIDESFVNATLKIENTTNYYYYFGGFVGRPENNSVLRNSYVLANMDLRRDHGSSIAYTGGVAGKSKNTDYINVYRAGNLYVHNDAVNKIGGFLGDHETGTTYQNSFWENTRTNIQNAEDQIWSEHNVTFPPGKSKNELKDLTTFTSAGWDFADETNNGTEDIWGMDTQLGNYNQGFPFLLWQNKGNNSFEAPSPPPSIINAEVLADNLQVELTFNKLVYGSETNTSSLQESDFNFTIQGGTANLSSATPSSISVSGTSVLLGIPINGNVNGDEVLTISCVASSVFDVVGNTSTSTISLNLNEPKYYWVGGSGDWTNINTHWSKSSGGNSFHTTLPNQFSTVIFDVNSFSTTGAIVNMDVANVSIRSMDWSTATNTPTLNLMTAGTQGEFIEVSGSVSFTTAMIINEGMWASRSGFRFNGSNDASYYPAGQNVGMIEVNKPNGEFNLRGAILASGYASLHVISGHFKSNNHPIYIYDDWNHRFKISGSASGTIAELGTSSITIGSVGSDSPPGTLTLNYNSGSLTTTLTNIILGKNSTINTNEYNTPIEKISIKNGSGYANINIPNAPINNLIQTQGNTGDINISGPTSGIGTATIRNGLTFSSNDDHSLENLILSGQGMAVNLRSGQTYTISNTLSFLNDSCAMNTLKSSEAGSQATLHLISDNVTSTRLNIKDIAVTGAGTFSASDSIDLGNNSGITFDNLVGVTLYWIGGSGDWSNGNQWSATSGGGALGCAPTGLDNVIFDVNSFSTTGAIVNMDVANVSIRSMDWSTATNTPTLNLMTAGTQGEFIEVSGSVSFTTAMIINEGMWASRSGFRFNGSNDASYYPAGQNVGMIEVNKPNGEFNLRGAILASGYASLHVISGHFKSNNHPIYIYDDWNHRFKISGSASGTIAELGTSSITIGSVGSDSPPGTLTLNYNSGSLTTTLTNIILGKNSTINTNEYNTPIEKISIKNGSGYANINIPNAPINNLIQTQGNTGDINISGPTSGIGTINISGGLIFSSNDDHSFENLILSGQNSAYTFRSGQTYTISNSLSSENYIGLASILKASTNGSQATISMPNSDFCLDYINIKDINFVDSNSITAGPSSVDSGNNSGVTFLTDNSLSVQSISLSSDRGTTVPNNSSVMFTVSSASINSSTLVNWFVNEVLVASSYENQYTTQTLQNNDTVYATIAIPYVGNGSNCSYTINGKSNEIDITVTQNPYIAVTSLSGDNAMVTIIFNKPVYTNSNGTGALTTNDFSLTQSGGTAIINSSQPTALTQNGNAYSLAFSTTGSITGNEILTILPATGSTIYDSIGNPVTLTQFNNTVNLYPDTDNDGVNDP